MRALATLLLAASASLGSLAACAGDVSTSGDDDSATPNPDAAPSAPPDAAVDPGSLAAACAPVIAYEDTTTSGNDARFEAHVTD